MNIFFICALRAEAKPFIEALNLKKLLDQKAFDVYKRNNFFLCISGIGKVKAAAATAYVLTAFSKNAGDILINCGVAGYNTPLISKGETVLINKITDQDTSKEFFPNIIISHSYKEHEIHTFSKAVSLSSPEKKEFVDMESSGVYIAASRFLYLNNIYFLKVALDNLSPEGIKEESILSVMSENVNSILNFAESADLLSQNTSFEFNFSQEDERKLSELFEKMKLTKSMKDKVMLLLKKRYVCGKKTLPDMQNIIFPVTNKDERKKEFDKLIEYLS
jgi:hypothetical protein